MPLNKKYVVLEYLDHPIFVAAVVDGTTESYLAVKKQAMMNFKAIKEEYHNLIAELRTKVNGLEKEIKHLKGED